MLVSRPLNRRVRQLASYRPSSSSQSHLALRRQSQSSSQQRSLSRRFSTAAFSQSASSSQSASQPFVTFVMHRLNNILTHSLSGAVVPPPAPHPSEAAGTSTGTESSLASSYSVPIMSSSPSTLDISQVRASVDFPIASPSGISLSNLITRVVNATQSGSAPAFHMREAASPSTSSGPTRPSIRGLFSEIHAKGQPKQRPPFKTPQFRLDYGRACIAHRSKRDRNPDKQRLLCSSGCGEDSVFVGQNALCVADGVGGWADKPGADSAKISRLLTHYASLKVDENRRDEVHSDPTDVVKHAILKTQTHKIKGTTTCCLVVCEGDTAYTYNIGDSGYVLIRNGEVIKRSVETTWAFNAPEQVGYPPRYSSDPEQKSSTDEFAIQPNDLFVLMTDGVLDNVFEDEIVAIVKEGYESSDALAKNIADAAHRFSLDAHRRSPFTVAAETYGRGSGYLGGKEDDIAVVVGVVREAGDADDDDAVKSRL